MELLNIFFKSLFVENLALAFFLGMCSFIAVSKNMQTARGLGFAVIIMLLVTIPLNWAIGRYLLAPGALKWISPAFAEVDLSFLTFIVFIAVIAAMTQVVEMVVEKYMPSLHLSLGIFLPLIAVNCAILGASLFMQERAYTGLGQVLAYAAGSGLGWFLAIVSLAAIRERLRYSDIPRGLQGMGITFLVVGLMGLAFMGFMGIRF
ncbi:MAG: NADH:ubiquinone reductase (Na(+)-transporting) subunit E [Bacteroidales bacterium]|nr:NADH:ubiquinone reductase (Na(+)-transporting) subunit E [Bacteroidales bacterium]